MDGDESIDNRVIGIPGPKQLIAGVALEDYPKIIMHDGYNGVFTAKDQIRRMIKDFLADEGVVLDHDHRKFTAYIREQLADLGDAGAFSPALSFTEMNVVCSPWPSQPQRMSRTKGA